MKDIQTHQINNLSYIPSVLFVITQLVYNFFKVGNSIFWSIFYFSSIYAVLIIWTTIELIRIKDNLSKLYHIGIGMGLSFLIYLEIKSIVAKGSMGECAYVEYMKEINSYENSMLFALILLIIMVTILLRLWKS